MQRIYVDTSVFGGLFDKEFKTYSELFWKHVLESESKILMSSVTRDEIQDAPKNVQTFAAKLPKSKVENPTLARAKFQRIH